MKQIRERKSRNKVIYGPEFQGSCANVHVAQEETSKEMYGDDGQRCIEIMDISSIPMKLHPSPKLWGLHLP